MPAQSTALPTGQGQSAGGPAEEPSRDRIAYTVADVAQLLGKNVGTVYDWVQKGALPSQRIGGTIYIPKWALADLLAPAANAPPVPPAGGEAA